MQAQVVDRARILLLKAEEQLTVKTVQLCISKYKNGGIDEALFDNQRCGRPPEIFDDSKVWIIAIACQRPSELGYAQELWTLKNLHVHIQQHADEVGYPRLSTVTNACIQKLLKTSNIKPFNVKYYCETT